MSTFNQLLSEQIGHEFAASQQYLAIAVWYEDHAMPRMAAHFFRQAIEERNHAMMLVQYRLDRGWQVFIPGVPEVRNDFANHREPIELSLAQEQEISNQIQALFKAARSENDGLGEQAMLWFLKEQVEEIAAMTTLLTIVNRTENLFDIENFVARDLQEQSMSSDTPPVAGGTL